MKNGISHFPTPYFTFSLSFWCNTSVSCTGDASVMLFCWGMPESRFQLRLQERQHQTNHHSSSFDDCGQQIWHKETPNKGHNSQSKSCSPAQLLSWPYSHTKPGAWLVLNTLRSQTTPAFGATEWAVEIYIQTPTPCRNRSHCLPVCTASRLCLAFALYKTKVYTLTKIEN